MAVILLSEALRIFHSGATCSITYVTADYKRGTGGQLVHIPACVIWSQKNITEPGTPGAMVDEKPIINHQSSIINKKPSHWIHKTRNIYIPKTQKIQKFHIKLMTQFNGKKVLL
jgi:hypothetical protein